MISKRSDYDVAVIGASIAGCTTATLLARQGARVALIDRRPDPDAFKRVCGHYIQPSAEPTLTRLGLTERLERAGAYRGRPRMWSRYGWSLDPTVDRPELRSISIRREVLDPLLRRTAAETPGVELMLGCTLSEVLRDGRRAAGVTVKRRAGDPLRVRAKLVVGADGRGSATARSAGVRTRKSTNARFAYWGYFEGPRPASGAGVELWLLEPDIAIATPTDAGLTLYVAFAHRRRLPEFKSDPEAALRAYVGALPDPPPIADSRRVGSMVGKVEMANEWRRAASPGLALVGDAAIAADPVAAIGCGWALQSAEWLADEVAPALAGDRPLSRALRSYRRRHRRGLLGHSLLLADGARGKPMSPIQRLLFRGAAVDAATAEQVERFAARLIGPGELLRPAPLMRAVRRGRAHAGHRRPAAA